MEIFDELSSLGIVPVVAIDRAEDAENLAGALCRGGLPCAEVTFRTAAAEDAIRIMSSKYPNMIIGAGTVLTPEQVDKAVAAGAKFIVSPGLNPDVVKHCVSKQIPIIPGCATPSEIELALSLGLTNVKFFPAEAAGGISMIKAMSAPYSNVKFMPTGGINANNLNEYLSFNKVIACGGSWMVSKSLINDGKFDEIENLTREAVGKMLSFEISKVEFSVGNNCISDLLSEKISFCEESDLDSKGTLYVSTNSVKRAYYHLGKKGLDFDSNFVSTNEIAGFKIKLIQK